MRKNNCEVVRRELDELMIGEACSTAASQHLRECASCREFHEQTTKLRRIVGSLGTVEAPADFDFRLRARLANDASNGSTIYWPFARRGLAVAAMVIVLATIAFVVRDAMKQPERVENVAQQPEVLQPAKRDEAPPVVKEDKKPESVLVANADDNSMNIRKDRRSSTEYRKRAMATVDSSFEGAGVISGIEPVGVSAPFPIDASVQSFRVSLDDGRGNAKTISVPTISFGSQRFVQTANQSATKRAW